MFLILAQKLIPMWPAMQKELAKPGLKATNENEVKRNANKERMKNIFLLLFSQTNH
jgi:hypothetical protein